MKIRFKDQQVTANGNSWSVSGYWDTDTSQINLSRIEGAVSGQSADGIGEACYNLAIDKGWL